MSRQRRALKAVMKTGSHGLESYHQGGLLPLGESITALRGKRRNIYPFIPYPINQWLIPQNANAPEFGVCTNVTERGKTETRLSVQQAVRAHTELVTAVVSEIRDTWGQGIHSSTKEVTNTPPNETLDSCQLGFKKILLQYVYLCVCIHK